MLLSCCCRRACSSANLEVSGVVGLGRVGLGLSWGWGIEKGGRGRGLGR